MEASGIKYDQCSMEVKWDYKQRLVAVPPTRFDPNKYEEAGDDVHDCSIHGFGLDFESFGRNNTSEIGKYDVLCGRHKVAFNNIGNRRFRITVALSLDRYLSAGTRREKSQVIHSVASLVHRNGGRFLQHDHGKWIELNEDRAHKKVAHAMRDASAKVLQPLQLHEQEFGADAGVSKPKTYNSGFVNTDAEHYASEKEEIADFERHPLALTQVLEYQIEPIDLIQVDESPFSLDDQALSLLLKDA